MNKDIATMKTIGYTKILNIDALSITEKQPVTAYWLHPIWIIL